jgi:hypothetical protein
MANIELIDAAIAIAIFEERSASGWRTRRRVRVVNHLRDVNPAVLIGYVY